MHEDDKIDFSLGEIPADAEPEEETSSPTAGDSHESASAAAGKVHAASPGNSGGEPVEEAGPEGKQEKSTDPPAKFHTRRNAPTTAGFYTNMAGYGAGVAQETAVHERKRKKAAEEAAPPRQQAKLWLRAAIQAAAITAAAVLLIYIALTAGDRREDIDVHKYKDAVAVTVDGEDMTISDLAFYIMYEEAKVEHQAEIYNPDNTRDYWNILMNGVYLSARVKEMVMGMAVHDRIFYNEAVKAGITLSEEEKTTMENRRTDFWEDLYPSQTEDLFATRDDINHVIYEIGLAEKYQQKLAIENNVSYNSYDWNGKNYEKLRDEDHKVKVNDSIWHRFHMGNNTLTHGQANFIQGRDKQKTSEE